ncbi:AraC family transcriptional regulator [Paenibacillus cymbidii]|uniref:AraC family transcriptional regulator n=1 Tax=Paenibacillus cymbidii TaxID=1639034 RepID=UPI00108157C2|nr:AraC family transcriptional regulator [Paenibacillus cymbidii]
MGDKKEFGKPRLREKAKFHFDHLYMNDPQVYDSVLLYQVGDLSCDAGFSIGDHIQVCYEISYITSGSGYYRSNESRYPVKAGDLYLNLPGEHHDGEADENDPFRYYYIGFGFDTTKGDYNNLTHIQRMFDQVRIPVVRDRFGIESAFLGIFNELIHLKEYSDLLIKTYIYQIILLTYRNFFESWEKQYSRINNADENNSVIYDMIHFIDINLEKGNMIKLPQLEEELGYSYSHLSHLFSQKTGLAIKQYYNRKRFEKAVEWLKDSSYTITQISEKLGYLSIHSFSKAFRKSYGISPSEYQQLVNNRKKGTTD